jgi:hypothetical protein
MIALALSLAIWHITYSFRGWLFCSCPGQALVLLVLACHSVTMS